eukprot:1149872-Pelagomonas_calceolata.AAC.3
MVCSISCPTHKRLIIMTWAWSAKGKDSWLDCLALCSRCCQVADYRSIRTSVKAIDCWLIMKNDFQERKGKDYIAVPAYVGSLAEAKNAPVSKSIRFGGQKYRTWSQHFKHADTRHAQ